MRDYLHNYIFVINKIQFFAIKLNIKVFHIYRVLVRLDKYGMVLGEKDPVWKKALTSGNLYPL